jgi:hypothetical protein
MAAAPLFSCHVLAVLRVCARRTCRCAAPALACSGADVRQIQADIERLGDGHERGAVPCELLPGGDVREVDIEQLADRGAAEVRGSDRGSPDIAAVRGQHPVLQTRDLRRIAGLTRDLDRDGLLSEVQQLKQAPPDRRHLDHDRCRGRRRTFGHHDKEVPVELVGGQGRVCQPAVVVGPLPEAELSTLACRPQSSASGSTGGACRARPSRSDRGGRRRLRLRSRSCP